MGVGYTKRVKRICVHEGKPHNYNYYHARVRETHLLFPIGVGASRTRISVFDKLFGVGKVAGEQLPGGGRKQAADRRLRVEAAVLTSKVLVENLDGGSGRGGGFRGFGGGLNDGRGGNGRRSAVHDGGGIGDAADDTVVIRIDFTQSNGAGQSRPLVVRALADPGWRRKRRNG